MRSLLSRPVPNRKCPLPPPAALLRTASSSPPAPAQGCGNKGGPARPIPARPSHGGRLTCGGDAGALLSAQGRHGPAARRAHGGRRHMQLPVVVVVVAEPRSRDGRRQCGGGSHGPGVKSAVVGGAAVERVPVEAGENDGRGARGQQHRVLAARSGRQDIVDAEHAHRHAPNRAGQGGGDRPGEGGRRAGGRVGGGWGRGGEEAGRTRNRNFSDKFEKGIGAKRKEPFPRAACGQSVRVCLCARVRCVCVRAGSTPGTFPPQLSPVYWSQPRGLLGV